MSLADKLVAITFDVWNSVHADQWVILSGDLAGQYFTADTQSESPLVLSTDLGEDAREKTLLFCWRPALAITQGTRISGKGHTWRVVARDDNPINARIKFEIVKVVTEDT